MLLEIDDIANKDALLGPVLTGDIMQEADDALYALAAQYGAAREDVKKGFWVERYVEAYAFYRAALKNSYSAGGTAYNEGDSEDAYAQKVKFYQNEIKSLESKMSYKVLTGKDRTGSTGPYLSTIRLHRG